MALASPDHDSPTSLPGSKVLLLFYLVNMRNPINPNCGTVHKSGCKGQHQEEECSRLKETKEAWGHVCPHLVGQRECRADHGAAAPCHIQNQSLLSTASKV